MAHPGYLPALELLRHLLGRLAAARRERASPRYPGGVALRFARVRGYRPDKSADEADTIEAVRALHSRPAT